MAGTGSLSGPIIVGAVGVELVPIGKGFLARTKAELGPEARKLGQDLGREMGAAAAKPITEQIARGAKNGLDGGTDEATKAGAKAGAKFGETFKRTAKTALADAKRVLGDVGVNIGADTGGFTTEVKIVQAELKKLARETVDVKVRADTLGALANLKALEQQTRKTNSATGKFARELQSGLEKALSDLPDVDLDFDIDSSDLDEETKKILTRVAAVRRSLEALSAKRLGVDFDGEQAIAELATINREITAINQHPVDVRVKSDLGDVEKDLAALTTKLTGLKDQQVEVTPKVDDAALGQVRTKIVTALDQAQKAIGDLPVGVDATEAQTEIQAIKTRIAELHAQVKIGLDETEALRKIATLNIAMKTLTGRHDIDIGTKGNGNEVTRIFDGITDSSKEASRAAGDAGGNIASSLLGTTPAAVAANANILLLAGAFVALGLTVSAIGAGIIGVLFAIGAAVIVALGVLGALLIVLAPIITALTKLATGNKAAATAAATNAAHHNALANALDAVLGAEESLAAARRNAATTVRNNARAEQQAAQGVTDALSEQVAAQAALTKAKKDTTVAQRDLTLQLAGARLDAKGAQIAVKRAEQQVNILAFDPKANDLDKEEALNNYQQAVLRAKETKNTAGDLLTQQQAARKAGVDGTEAVRSAQVRLTKAQREVVDAYQKQKDAATDAANAQIAAATQITQAQRALDAAKRGQSEAKTTAATPAANTDPLAGLSQPAKDFVNFLRDTFAPEYKKIKGILEKPILAGLTKVLTSLSTKFPDLEGIAGTFGDAIKGMFDKIDDAVNSATFQSFLDYMRDNGGPILDNLTTILLGVGKGITDMLVALGPSTNSLLSGFAGSVQKFADFSQTDKFQDFIDYIIDNTPTFVSLLGSIVVIIGNLLIAFAPTAQLFLEGAAAVGKFMAGISPTAWGVIVAAIAGVVFVLAILAAIFMGPVAAVIGVIVAIGAAIVGISALVSAFPDFFTKAFAVIKNIVVGFIGGSYFVIAIDFIIKYFNKAFFAVIHGLKTGFDFVVKYFNKFLAFLGHQIGGFFSGLYDTAKTRLGHIGKFFTGIGDAIGNGFKGRLDGIKGFFSGIGDFFTKTIPGWFKSAKNAIGGFFKNPFGGGGKKGAGSSAFSLKALGLPDVGKIGDKITAGFRVTRDKVLGIAGSIRDKVTRVFTVIGGLWRHYIADPWNTAVAYVEHLFDLFLLGIGIWKGRILGVLTLVGKLWQTYIVDPWNRGVAAVRALFATAVTYVTGLRDQALALLTSIGHYFHDKVSAAWSLELAVIQAIIVFLRDKIIAAVRDRILAIFTALGGFFETWVAAPWRTAVATVAGIFTTVENAIGGARDRIKGVFATIGKFWDTHVIPAWNNAVKVVESVFAKIQGYAAVPFLWIIENAINPVLDAVNTAAGFFHATTSFHVDPPPAMVAAAHAVGHARGTGFVLPGYAPGVDTEYAVLSKGEAVLVPELTRQIGAGRIMAANHAARAGRKATPFATGGVAGVSNTYSNIDALLQIMNLAGITGAGVDTSKPEQYRAAHHPDTGKFHAQNQAVDFGVGKSEKLRGQIAEFWLGYSRSLVELIHTAPTGLGGWFVRNGAVDDSPFSAKTKATHRGHVHVAATAAALLSGMVSDFTTGTAPMRGDLDTTVGQIVKSVTPKTAPAANSNDVQDVLGKGIVGFLQPLADKFEAWFNPGKYLVEHGNDPKPAKLKKPTPYKMDAAKDAAARYKFLHPVDKATQDADAKAKASWHKTDPNVDRAYQDAKAKASWQKNDTNLDKTYLDAKAKASWHKSDVNLSREFAAKAKANAAKAAAKAAAVAKTKYYALHPAGTLFPKHMVGGKDLANLPRVVTQYAPQVVRALGAVGFSPFNVGLVLRRIALESAGNPKFAMTGPVAANKRRVGLTGLTADKMGAYAPPGSTGASDPYSNIFAAINYMNFRYGAMAKMDPYKNPALLYDQGGYLPPGLSMVMNKTKDPEPILNGAQWEAMMSDKKSSMQGGLSITHTVRDGQIAGLIDSRIDTSFGVLADAKIYSGR